MRPVPDPVSWLMIRPGWKVFSSDGSEVGQIDEVAGDDSHDIFDGLAVATSALGKPRYVPAEQVGTIFEGEVHLSLSAAEVSSLGDYLEPATSAQIEPDDRGGFGEGVAAEARKLEGKAFAPTQKHEHEMNVWRRLWFLIRRRLPSR
jgi:hypothetical protein